MSADDATPAGSMLHVVGTADVLVCLTSDRGTAEQFTTMRDLLAERFPGFNFTFIQGVSGVMVAQR